MSEPPSERAAPPFPGWAGLGAAIRFLTPAGVAGRVDASAVYYPLVGLVIGAVWLVTDRLLSGVAGPTSASVVVVLIGIGLTGGRPLLALGRALLGRWGAVAGYVAAALLAGLEVWLVDAQGRYRPVGLLFAPLLGCCSLVVLAVGAREARADGRRVKFAPLVTFREFGVASTATFALIFLTTEFLGLLLILYAAALSLAARVGLHRWRGGVDDTTLRASGAAIELMVLALLVAL
jgi:cobalamin synthase